MKSVDQDGCVIHIVRTLDLINGKHYELSFKDSVCIRREESPSRILFSSGEYSHCTLYNHPELTFKPLPYKPSPYPELDIHSIRNFIHYGENKAWSIVEFPGDESALFYKNENTRGRLVFQHLEKTNVNERVKAKIREGYTQISEISTYQAASRTLIKS